VVVVTRDVFSEQELAQLRGFPEITRAELIKYFTLTGADEGFVRKFAGQRNVLGTSVQLCSLPWLGFVPDEITAAPEEAVTRLADRLGIRPPSWPGMASGRRLAPIIFGRSCAIWGGARRACRSGRSWMSSCSPGRWSTIRRSCCSRWRASF